MKYPICAFLLSTSAVAAAADDTFDYTQCASIHDVSVPYEIELEKGIHFLFDGQRHLSITEDDRLLDAAGQPYNTEARLESAMAVEIREFVRIGQAFAAHFGTDQDTFEWSDRALEETGEDALQLFSDSCRNLYHLKRIQSRIGARDVSFAPVIFVHGFDQSQAAL